ncbi:MAG: hypothetical protein IPK31_02095 [Chitinophagaceae bacterium]|nr:hypothetical protein [Chitinophagaceae bacterium]
MEIRLQEFIRKVVEEINSGLSGDYVVDDTIDFEVSVTTSTNKSGGLEIKVLTGEISKSNELVQKVFFSIINQKDKIQADKKTADNVIKFIDKGIKAFNKHSEEIKKEKKLT